MKPEETAWALPPDVRPERSRLGFDLDQALNAMVSLSIRVPDEAYTAPILGSERSGNGCVIGDDGLVLTIGYLITEAQTMAGADTKGHPAGTKTGDVIHVFRSGSIQLLTDVNIDPAGNVWAANNWNDPVAAAEPNPPNRISTWGGGSGLTVIYGVAAPVKPPRMGKVQGY
jgi:hypothetical protein